MKKMGMIFGSLIFVLAAVLAVLAVTDAQKSRLLQQEMKRMENAEILRIYGKGVGGTEKGNRKARVGGG